MSENNKGLGEHPLERELDTAHKKVDFEVKKPSPFDRALYRIKRFQDFCGDDDDYDCVVFLEDVPYFISSLTYLEIEQTVLIELHAKSCFYFFDLKIEEDIKRFLEFFNGAQILKHYSLF